MPTTQQQLGQAGLVGWRKGIADRVAPPAAKRSPVTEDQVRAVIGSAFYVLSVYYVVSTTARMIKNLRS